MAGTGTGGMSGGGGMAGTGTGGMAGAAGGTGDPAQIFCSEYETVCTFGGADRYTDMADCIAKFNSYDAARQACVTTHLGLAKTQSATTHCPHATGQAPCN